MARDTKKTRGGSSGGGGGSGIFAGLLIGLFIGIAVAIGVVFYMNRGENPFASSAKTKTPPVDAVRPAVSVPTSKPEILRPGSGKGREELASPPAVNNTPAASQPAPTKAGEYDFYRMLQGNEKAQEPKKVETPQPTKVETPKGSYLQVGAFQKEEDADNLKAKLALIGVEARIQTTEIKDKGLWHRVRVGPFANAQDLDRTRDLLKQNGVDSQAVKAN